MAINVAATQVPNVYVNIIPPNPLLNGVPTNIIGVVGTATWGPVNSQYTIGSMQQYVQIFGNPIARQYDMGTAVYMASQQGANNFLCVRVTDGTDTFASANLLDTSSATGAVLSSKYTGSLGNSTSAILSAGSTSNTYKLTLSMSGGVPEVFDNIGGSGVAFWSNLVSAVNQGQGFIRGPSQLCTAVTANYISSVTVNAAGSYTSLPTLGTSGPGSGATLNPVMDAILANVVAAGSGYAVGDTIDPTGGTHSVLSVLQVATAKLVSLAINAAGSGYNVGDTIVLAGGTFSSAAVITVDTVNGSGGILTFAVTSGGSYTVESTTFTQGSTSGVGSGATFQTGVFGVNTVTVQTAGSYTALPTNPVSQGSTSGSGTGATFNMNWGLLSVVVSAQGSGYTSASMFTVSGSGGASGTLNLGSATSPSIALPPNPYTLSGGTDGANGVNSATLVGSDTSTPRTGMYALRKSLASIVMLADATDYTQYSAQQIFGDQENIYMVGVEQAGLQDNIAQMVSILVSSSVRDYNFKLLGGDWEQIFDPFNNINRFVSPQGSVAGILAVNLPSSSSLNKIMNGILATQKTFEQRIYSDADLLTLENGGIEIVTQPIPASSSAFGCRLGINTSANALQRFDNYPRMVNFLANTFKTGLGQFIGLPQTVDVRNQARSTLQGFLQNLVDLGMIGNVNGGPAFSVILDASNNPSNQVALGFMQANIQVTLFSIIQVFIINLQAGQNVQVSTLPPQLA